MAMRRLLFTTAILLAGCNAGLAQVSTIHGTFIDARDDRHIAPQWPESVLGDDSAWHSRHDAGAGAAGFRPHNAGNGGDLFYTRRANRAWNSGGVGYVDVGHGRHDWNDAIRFRRTDDTGRAGHRVHNG